MDETPLRFIVFVLVALGLLAGTAGARPGPGREATDGSPYTNPNNATNSDLAFWGKHAFIGYYTGDAGSPAGTPPRGGVRIFDISNPASPSLVKDIACDANQNDPIVWDRNGNGVADLLLMAVDRTMASPVCGAPRVAHGDPTGWEGVRVFTLSDNPANPFANVDAGRGGLHGLRRPHDHALAGQGRGAGRQADRVRLLVSTQARADVRPGQRPAGRERPAALEDLGRSRCRWRILRPPP